MTTVKLASRTEPLEAVIDERELPSLHDLLELSSPPLQEWEAGIHEILASALMTIPVRRTLSLGTSIFESCVSVRFYPEQRTVEIEDNGMGPTEVIIKHQMQDVIRARQPGWKEKIKEAVSGEYWNRYVGRLAKGLISVFQCCNSVELETKEILDGPGMKFSTDGQGTYELVYSPKQTVGTICRLMLNDFGAGQINSESVKSIIPVFWQPTEEIRVLGMPSVSARFSDEPAVWDGVRRFLFGETMTEEFFPLRPVPVVAPRKWADYSGKAVDKEGKKLTPRAFFLETYGPWIGRGLTRASIRKLDITLYKALNSAIARNADWLARQLPTLQRTINNEIAEKVSNEEELAKRLQDLEREASAIRRRLKNLRRARNGKEEPEA